MGENVDILEYATEMQCQELHMGLDKEVELKAIIAIHNTHLGPALGGCRCIEYPTTVAAAVDAIRLAQAMTYKAAIPRLPLGGGKMVLLKPKQIGNRTDYFKAVGHFVENLNGRYITAVDSGTSMQDMDIIASVTSHVTSTSKSIFSVADPSVMAALGAQRGIRAAVQFKLGKNSLNGLHITVQGLGHAGYNLTKNLYEAGAKLTVYDVNPKTVQRCVAEFGVKVASSLEELLQCECDVFAPCALGAILNDSSIALLKTPIVAGIANNQLEESKHGITLMKRDILYAPDYVINAGGLIYVAAQYSRINEITAKQKVEDIYDTLMEIFQRASRENLPTNQVADMIAIEHLNKS